MLLRSKRSSSRSAFTLIELLVVMAIIGVLVGMLLPAVQQVREAGRRTSCSNNLKNIAIAAVNYESALRRLPDGLWLSGSFDPSGTGAPYNMNYYGHSVFVKILPYMEQKNVYDLWNFKELAAEAKKNSMDALGNLTVDAPSATIISSYLCPSDQYPNSPVEYKFSNIGYPQGFFGITSYLASAGTKSTYFRESDMDDNGVFYMTGPGSKPGSWLALLEDNAKSCRMAAISDGSSQTFFFGERYHLDPNFDDLLHKTAGAAAFPIQKYGAWGWFGGGNGTAQIFGSTEVPLNYLTPPTAPTTIPAAYDFVDERLSAYGSGHPAGANFAFSDGSVRFIADQINFITYQALSTKAGTEVVSSDFQ